MLHILLAVLLAIGAGIAISRGPDGVPPADSPRVVETVASIPPGLSDSWPIERRDVSDGTRLGLGVDKYAPTVRWIACERDIKAKQDTFLVGRGSHVRVFRTVRLGINWGSPLVGVIPVGVASPYSELLALDVPVSPDLAYRLLAAEPSGSCGS